MARSLRKLALLSVLGLSVSFANPATAALPPGQIVYLLLHGLASDPSTWDDLVKSRFGGNCPITAVGADITAQSNCYRHRFADRTVDGRVWTNGDGASFRQLGEEVGLIVDEIAKLRQPKAIVLVGHSRGGLAARAFLQSASGPQSYKLGLLTIGSPHQGSPFGRMQYWLRHVARGGKGYAPEDVLFGDILGDSQQIETLQSLLFSPSAGYLATAHDAAMRPIRNEVSEAIWALNDGAPGLGQNVSAFAQIYSDGLRLGQKTPFASVGFFRMDDDILDDNSILARLLVPGDFIRMRQFMLSNIGRLSASGNTWKCLREDQLQLRKRGWACNGDSIVPTISQHLNKLPGFSAMGKPFHQNTPDLLLHKVHHINETGKVLSITPLLRALKKDLR